jgi:hypothetical protein
MTQGTYLQEAFVSGELAPAMYGRVTHPKYKFGATTMRNGFVNFQGGYASRAGGAYIGMCKQAAPNPGGVNITNGPPKDVPFQYSTSVAYELEFGDYYMRPKYHGAYVTEVAKTVTSVSAAGLFTATAHGFSNGDWVYDSGNTGFSGLTWIVQNITTNTFTVTDLFGTTISSATASTGGTVARIYTVVSPYVAIDLPYLKYTQSADEMSLTCYNQSTLTEYPPYDLQLITPTDWVFSETTFTSSIGAPTNIQATAQSSTTLNTWYSYVVTAVDAVTAGDESIASVAVQVHNNDISINAGSNTITWDQVTGAASYNIYQSAPYYDTGSTPTPQIGVPYGFVGSALGTSFVDNNIIPDFTTTPPLHNNPFARGQITGVIVTAGGSGLSQSTANYTINTTTGSGFNGTPIISSGGNLSGFLVNDSGAGYAPIDTIVIVTGGSAASGRYIGTSSNPSDSQTIILNGVTWTFKTAPSSPTQTKIQSTVNGTFQQLASDLAASGNSLLTAANYSVITSTLNIGYAEIGTAGNGYTMASGSYGGTPSAGTLTGGSNGTASSAKASLVIGPESGTYPGAVGYFQERRAYANTENNPDTYYFSQPGNYSNMDSSIPSVDSDAIIGTPWAQQVNGIQFLTPMPGGLVIFTGSGLWQLSGGNTVALTPADQDAQPQSRYGCSSTVPPIPINFHILYIRENNGIVYDLVYNFFANIYTGSDITVFSTHLFQGYNINQWAYSEKPNKLIWAIRNDGVMLSLTYIAEQEEQGWARHDTNGLYVGVSAIEEPPVDAVYTIVQRYVRGHWIYYSERFDNRIWANSEDCFCVDAGLTYPMTFPNAILTAASAKGTNNITSALIAFGGSGYTSPSVTAVMTNGISAISNATFNVTVSSGAITAITPVLTGAGFIAGETQLYIIDPTGFGCVAYPTITNNVDFSASTAVFNSGMVGDVIRTGNGLATIVTYNSTTSIIANITQPITAVVNNDPNFTPIPQVSGNWSIATPTTTVTGLNHLEGMTVTGLADGGVIPSQVVTNGSITLQQAASAITIGLPFLPQLQLLELEIPSQSGTSQTKRKNIPSVGLKYHDSRGISVGVNQIDASTVPGQVNQVWTGMVEVKERNQDDILGSPIPLSTRDNFINVPSEWSVRGQVAIQQSYPLPANIDCVVSYWNEGDS